MPVNRPALNAHWKLSQRSAWNQRQAIDIMTENPQANDGKDHDSNGAKSLGMSCLSVIIAANNEENYISDCLISLLAQHDQSGPVEVIVSANGCTDRTVQVAESHRPAFETKNWRLIVLDLATPGKANALNNGDGSASGDLFMYLDADVRCDPALLGQLRQALGTPQARYASGTLKVAPAKSWITRQYARFWVRLPFVQSGAVGAGLFSVNRAGRARWGEFPAIIADDTFVRLQFAPNERQEVPAFYHWPMIEGFQNLVKVRKRQDEGVLEVRKKFPAIMANENKPRLGRLGTARLFAKDPVGFLVYAAVHVSVRLRRSTGEWKRGR